MTEEIFISAEWDNDREDARGLAEDINNRFNSGENHLTSIKVCINPEYKKANIYAGYEDVSRLRETGSEDSMSNLCEAYIEWPHKLNQEDWADYIYPKTQMMRAFLLSRELKTQLIVLSYDDKLKCFMEDGVPHIEKI